MTKSNQLTPRIVIRTRDKDGLIDFYLVNSIKPIAPSYLYDMSMAWITLSFKHVRICSRRPDILTYDRDIELTHLFSEIAGGESLVRNYRHQKCRDGILRYQQIMLLLSQPKKP